ncbi:MAG TPA: universal stress protein [Hyphomicrobiaceae bacterium]|nr:universal stress protein [Hyphomicrobiaceae bacterium]
MYKNILLPTDGTEFCERSVKHGIALAKQLGARVTGVTVMVPMRATISSSLPADLQDEIANRAATNANTALAVVANAAKAAGVPCDTVIIRDEQPYEGIIDAAKKNGCDLIVMASHGRRGISAVMLGSETQKVITHTTIPVLVCR